MASGLGPTGMQITLTPEVVVPDTSPLIHLAAVGQLPLLNALGRVVVVDVVAFEATADLAKPFAPEIGAWIEEGGREGSNLPVRIATTEIGEAYRLARQTDPGFRLRNGGEQAILSWLADELPSTQGPALVVYENGRVPRMIRREGLSNVVVVATTRAILTFAEQQGLIRSAEATWQAISTRAPGANPELQTRIIRPTRGPSGS